MYISRIRISEGEALFQLIQQAGYQLMYHAHQILWKLFPVDKKASRDFLFRMEINQGKSIFYVVSERKPESVMTTFLNIDTKQYKPKIKKGDMLAFSLRANPTIAKKVDGKKNSVRHDVYMNAKKDGKMKGFKGKELNQYINERVKEWLIKREKYFGFQIDPANLSIEGYFHHQFYKTNTKMNVRYSSIDYHGILMVTEPIKFTDTLYNGIGKSKAFGCGLLLVKRIN